MILTPQEAETVFNALKYYTDHLEALIKILNEKPVYNDHKIFETEQKVLELNSLQDRIEYFIKPGDDRRRIR